MAMINSKRLLAISKKRYALWNAHHQLSVCFNKTNTVKNCIIWSL